ncbi:MAG: NUDIX hydrolase [Rhodomicrobium sp.]
MLDTTQLLTAAERDGVQKLVVGAVIERGGDVLILRRAQGEDFSGLHEIPSGTVDAGEDLIGALRREVSEETGLTVERVLRYVNSFDYLSGSGRKTRQLNFAVEASGGPVTLNPHEHDEALWADPVSARFEALNLSKETRASILAALDGGAPTT